MSEWRSILRQLTVAELVVVERLDSFNVLRLGPEARAVLRGERTVQFRREKREPGPARQRQARRERGTAGTAADREGFEALRALRRRLASEQGVAPFMVFHDSVLHDMLDRRPTTLEKMAEVPGVGATKLQRYGQVFLEAIREMKPLPID